MQSSISTPLIELIKIQKPGQHREKENFSLMPSGFQPTVPFFVAKQVMS
jgi:hypothetical protein